MGTVSTTRRAQTIPRGWRIGAVVLVILLVGYVGSLLFWQHDDAFQINGVPFPMWVAQRPDFGIQDPLAAIEQNVVPHLVSILGRRPDPGWVSRSKDWIWKHLPLSLQARFYTWRPIQDWQLKRTAFMGLRFLGAEAKDALPEVLRFGRLQTNPMVRAAALVAALQIAPESPETFRFWREEWERTNYFARRDLAIYLRGANYPIAGSAPLLLKEVEQKPGSVTVLEAFAVLGDAARPAIPYILQEFKTPTYRGNMLAVLTRLGPIASEAAPAITAILSDKDPNFVAEALSALKCIGQEAKSSVPAIQPLLTNSDPTIRMLAAAAVASITGNPETAIPTLVEGLEGRIAGAPKAHIRVDMHQEMPGLVTSGPEAAAILLGELGPTARASIPALEQRLKDKNQWIRLAAAQALWRISGDSKKALPVLIAILDSEVSPTQSQWPSPGGSANYGLIRTIEAIEEMGPAAREAVPALKRVRTFSGPARRSVNAALAAIQKLQ